MADHGSAVALTTGIGPTHDGAFTHPTTFAGQTLGVDGTLLARREPVHLADSFTNAPPRTAYLAITDSLTAIIYGPWGLP